MTWQTTLGSIRKEIFLKFVHTYFSQSNDAYIYKKVFRF